MERPGSSGDIRKARQLGRVEAAHPGGADDVDGVGRVKRAPAEAHIIVDVVEQMVGRIDIHRLRIGEIGSS